MRKYTSGLFYNVGSTNAQNNEQKLELQGFRGSGKSRDVIIIIMFQLSRHKWNMYVVCLAATSYTWNPKSSDLDVHSNAMYRNLPLCSPTNTNQMQERNCWSKKMSCCHKSRLFYLSSRHVLFSCWTTCAGQLKAIPLIQTLSIIL